MPTNPEAMTVVVSGAGDVSALITDLVFGTACPGGDAECRFRILRNDPIIQVGGDISISDAVGTVWRGRVEIAGGQFWSGGGIQEITGRGYASSAGDQVYTNTKRWRAGTAITTVFLESCQDLCPSISPGGFLFDPLSLGRVLPEDSPDFVLSNAQQIWNWARTAGVTADAPEMALQPLDWRVYPNPSTPNLIVNVVPSAPVYYTIMKSASHLGDALRGGTEVHAVADLSQIYNRAVVKYFDPNTSPSGPGLATAATNPDHRYAVVSRPTGLVGIIRDRPIDLSSLGADQETAVGIASAAAAIAQNAMNTGRQLVLHFPQEIMDEVNTLVPLWRIRAGEMIQVDDLLIASLGLNGVSQVRFFMINATSWNEHARTQTLTCGPRFEFSSSIARAIRQQQMGTPDLTNKAIASYAGSSDPRPQRWFDMAPRKMQSNPWAPYATGSHVHAMPNGDITQGVSFSAFPKRLLVGTVGFGGLIRGTWTSWMICTDEIVPHNSIRFRVEFPPGLTVVNYDPNAFVGPDGTTGQILVETGRPETEDHIPAVSDTPPQRVKVTIAANAGSGGPPPPGVDPETQFIRQAALIFFGTRNLNESDPPPPNRPNDDPDESMTFPGP